MARLQPGRQASGTKSVRGERTCFQESLRALRRTLGAAPGSPLPASRSRDSRARSQAQACGPRRQLGVGPCPEPPQPGPREKVSQDPRSALGQAEWHQEGTGLSGFGVPEAGARCFCSGESRPEGGFHGAGQALGAAGSSRLPGTSFLVVQEPSKFARVPSRGLRLADSSVPPALNPGFGCVHGHPLDRTRLGTSTERNPPPHARNPRRDAASLLRELSARPTGTH